MLKVSQKLEYAIRAMIELAEHRDDETLTPAREIAERQQVPLRFLEQQLGALSRAGLVESFRGAGGGCRLARDPAEITVAEVADAIEGQIYPVFCLEPSDHTCFADSRCGLQGFWADVARAVQDVFERTTVADLAARHRKMAPGPVDAQPRAAAVALELRGFPAHRFRGVHPHDLRELRAANRAGTLQRRASIRQRRQRPGELTLLAALHAIGHVGHLAASLPHPHKALEPPRTGGSRRMVEAPTARCKYPWPTFGSRLEPRVAHVRRSAVRCGFRRSGKGRDP